MVGNLVFSVGVDEVLRLFLNGAHKRDRTADLVLTKDVLYQLSYMGLLPTNQRREKSRLCKSPFRKPQRSDRFQEPIRTMKISFALDAGETSEQVLHIRNETSIKKNTLFVFGPPPGLRQGWDRIPHS